MCLICELVDEGKLTKEGAMAFVASELEKVAGLDMEVTELAQRKLEHLLDKIAGTELGERSEVAEQVYEAQRASQRRGHVDDR